MTDLTLLAALPIVYFIAIALMPKMQEKRARPKFVPLETGEIGGYDPSKDPEKVMSGEVESYFD